MEATDIAEARRAPASAPERRRRDAALAAAWRALPYVLIAVIPAALLAPWFGVILDRDEGAYMVVAMGMHHGLVPYRDLFDHKPPLIYVVYWLSIVAHGGLWMPRVLASASLGATALCVIWVAREFGWNRPTSLAAGALCALATSNILLQTNANTEAFMILPMTASLALLIHGEREAGWAWYAGAGVTGALASLFKTSAAPASITLFFYILVVNRRELRTIVAYALGGLAPVVLIAAAFTGAHSFTAFFYSNVTYNRLYTGSTTLAAHLHGLYFVSSGVLLGGLVFWLLGFVGLMLAVRRRNHADVLLLVWAFGCLAGIKATGRENAHYYVELLPVAGLFGASALTVLLGIGSTRAMRLSTLGAVETLLVLHFVLYGSLASSAQSRSKIHSLYTSIHTCEAAGPALGAWARRNSSPSDTIYNLGRDTEIYYYAGRLPAARFMYDRPFPLDPSTVGQTATALERSRPAVIVDTFKNCTQPGVSVPPKIAAFVAQNYTLVTTIGDAKMYELNTRVQAGR